MMKQKTLKETAQELADIMTEHLMEMSPEEREQKIQEGEKILKKREQKIKENYYD